MVQFQYLELRFKSRVVRLIATVTFTAQIILYMGVVLYAPCLGLEAVTGFPVYATVLIVGISGAVYTSIVLININSIQIECISEFLLKTF